MPLTTLTRYLVRALTGPFVFGFTAVTGLLFLTAITQRFQELAGKGVGLSLILELMVLSLPHVVTLAVPMALFSATLYVFADLAQSRELVALAAGGVHPTRLLAPVAVLGLVASLLMLQFNDRVLASANARFQDRLDAIARSRPAVQLREGVVNALRPPDGSVRFVWVRAVDRESDVLHGVTVIDLGNEGRPHFVTAPTATSTLLPNGRDLMLRLQDGQIASASTDSAGTFHTMQFETHVIFLRNVVSGLAAELYLRDRAERELSIATLRARIHSSPQSGDSIRYRGELHRRFATAFACIVLMLLGPALGIRFASGGIGTVINLSIAVLFVFRVGIIVGDRLVDAGRVGPILGSWATVGLLLAVAVAMLRHSVGYAAHTSDGPGAL